MIRELLIAAALVAVSACAPRARSVPAPVPVPVSVAPPVVAKAPIPEVNPALPPVPRVTGPLEIRVVYPPVGHLIQSRDSNFVFGSVGNGDAGLTVNGILTPVWPNGAFMAWVPNPSPELSRYDIVATTGLDTVRLAHPVRILPPEVPPPPRDTLETLSPARYASLIGPAAYPSDTDRVVTAYALAGGIQRWFLIPGTVVKVTATKGADSHVELDSVQTIRIASSDLKMLEESYAAEKKRARAFTIRHTGEWTDVVIPVSEKPAYLVDVGPGSIALTLYGTAGPARRQPTARGPSGGYLSKVTARGDAQGMQYTLVLRGPLYGYQPLWEDTAFVLRVRRPPSIDPAFPLRGLTIAVDPGHPPVGANGPTGLYEAVPTLDVGLRMRPLLQARGATVLMTRETPIPVDLNLRPAMARRANAHAFVSIHLNAVPDGINPLRVNGTATYHYHLQSQSLAELTHRAILERLSLRDNGVKRENFAVVRGTWMPSILAEGLFIIVPDQEAAARTPEYRQRYAQALVEGLEDYFRALAAVSR